MNEKTIDLTPTWSAIGEVYILFAESNEQAAIRSMAPEIRKAFAIATATVAASADWDEATKAAFDRHLAPGMDKLEKREQS
jgi:hypothetical protein